MSTGKIKFFSSSKGYGFVIDDATGQDVFIHVTGLTFDGNLKENDKVSFEITEGKKGKQAINVRRYK